MALSLASISSTRARRAPRVLIVGPEKVGKTQFAAGADSPIFLCARGEEGTDEVDVAKFPTLSNYDEIVEAISALLTEPHEYKTVVFDSASAGERLVNEKACANNKVASLELIGGGYGKWKSETVPLWTNLLDGFDALRNHRNMAVIIIGHVKTKEFKDPETEPYTTYSFDIEEKAAAAITKWADASLFANFAKASVLKTAPKFGQSSARAVGDDRRVAYTQRRPAHPGGTRYAGIPYEIPLSWKAFKDALDKSRPLTPQEVQEREQYESATQPAAIVAA